MFDLVQHSYLIDFLTAEDVFDCRDLHRPRSVHFATLFISMDVVCKVHKVKDEMIPFVLISRTAILKTAALEAWNVLASLARRPCSQDAGRPVLHKYRILVSVVLGVGHPAAATRTLDLVFFTFRDCALLSSRTNCCRFLPRPRPLPRRTHRGGECKDNRR